MKQGDRPTTLPVPTIRRYPIYLREIRDMIAHGAKHVSSAAMAAKLGLDPVLARKDLAMAGVCGRPRRGYPAKELEEALNRALGWDNVIDAALVGVGALGRALLGYAGFKEQNLSIALAFDSDPELAGLTIRRIKVRSTDDMPQQIRRLGIRIGILTVPSSAAQECADMLVKSGITGIWNFTNVQLSVPEGVIVQNVDLAQSLAVLSHMIASL